MRSIYFRSRLDGPSGGASVSLYKAAEDLDE